MEVRTKSRAGPPQPEAGPRDARLVGGPVDRPDGRGHDAPSTAPARALTARRRPSAAGGATRASPVTTTRSPASTRDRRPARQGGQRPLRPRLLASASSATSAWRRAGRRAEHVRDRGGRARLRCAHLHRVRRRRCPTSACVYCGNCIGVCPTGALMFRTEHEMRAAGTWDESRADTHRHDLPVLRRGLHAHAPRAGQRDREGDVAARHRHHEGNLCVKGRFGFEFVQARPKT